MFGRIMSRVICTAAAGIALASCSGVYESLGYPAVDASQFAASSIDAKGAVSGKVYADTAAGRVIGSNTSVFVVSDNGQSRETVFGAHRMRDIAPGIFDHAIAVRSDDSGHYRIDHLPDGRWLVFTSIAWTAGDGNDKRTFTLLPHTGFSITDGAAAQADLVAVSR